MKGTFMIKLYENGAYLLRGVELVEDSADSSAMLQGKLGNSVPSKEVAKQNTIAYHI